MYNKLISIVEKNYDEMCKVWLKEVQKSEHMKHYQSFNEEEIVNRGTAVLDNLLKWLKAGAKSEEVENYYSEVGAARLKEGFPLTEVHYAIYLIKKIFWSYIDWKDAISGTFEQSTATQIMTIFNNYFDLSNFYITRGYFNELFNALNESKKFSKEELKRYLIKGAIELDTIEEDDIIWRHV